MAIQVSCKCGQVFTAKDELEGETVVCPRCHKTLTITAKSRKEPAASGAGGIVDLLEEAGIKEVKGPRCPKCAAPLKHPDAVLCVACGFELQSGKHLKAASVRVAGQRGHTEVAEILLSRAAETIKEDKLEEIKTRSQGLPAWAYLFGLIGLGAFAGAMFTMPKDQAFEITGYVVVGFGGLWSAYYLLRIVIVAFKERLSCGLLCLFLLPVYLPYFIFTRWDRCNALFIYALMGGGIIGIGFLLAAGIAPMMAGSGPAEPAAPPPTP